MPLLTSIIAASRRRVDPDAADYFARIVAAGSTISEPNKVAVNALVAGCKADGIWAAIKASCLLSGPDDLTGALVPLVGAAPTNFNFVAGDYNRVTGLVGNGSTKYLDSNRNNNADPQNNFSMSTWVYSAHDLPLIGCFYMGRGLNSDGASNFGRPTANQANAFVRARSSIDNVNGVGSSTGLWGVSRSASGSYNFRVGGSNNLITRNSDASNNGNINIFRDSQSSAYASARLSFYHVGESLDLAQLDARLTTYMSALT